MSPLRTCKENAFCKVRTDFISNNTSPAHGACIHQPIKCMENDYCSNNSILPDCTYCHCAFANNGRASDIYMYTPSLNMWIIYVCPSCFPKLLFRSYIFIFICHLLRPSFFKGNINKSTMTGFRKHFVS